MSPLLINIIHRKFANVKRGFYGTQNFHVDCNNFYAMVECSLDMSLRDKCVAVGGSVEERHGIILAKNYAAKAFGVKTGEAIWQARQKCRELVVVLPHYEEYLKYSRLAREVYARYTDKIEPYGMDECWLDITNLYTAKSAEDIANEIRETIKAKLGVTVSCGVSFNKVFAKLGSDMRKPDAVTVISRENFRDKIWGLPASEMIGVGRSTERILTALGIHTLGDLARCNPDLLQPKLKSRAYQLHAFANGDDSSVVLHKDFEVPAKSVGHGITTFADLENEAEVWKVMLELSQTIGRKLKIFKRKATVVSIFIRDSGMSFKQWQSKLPKPSQSAMYLASEAYELFRRSYNWKKPIRNVTISAQNLIDEDTPYQLDLLVDASREEKFARLDNCIFDLRERFGADSVRNACLLDNLKMRRHGAELMKMPSGMLYMSGC